MSDDASDTDWFERAISDDDADERVDSDGDSDADGDSDSGPDRHSGSATDDSPTDDTAAADGTGAADGSAAADSTDPADAPFDTADGSGDDGPFDDGSGDGVFGDDTDAGGLGGENGLDAGGSDDDGSLFDDDFESAFDAAGGPDDAGFEDEVFESAIPRIDLGIPGLDALIQGGVPNRHLIVTIGSAGTGKTTFGLQFLHHGLQQGENAVFITLEQSHDAIVATAEERGWEFERYEADDQLAVVDLDPVEMANSLDNIRGELPDLIEEFDADRLVLDSVSLLEMMYDDQARRRTEVFDFTRSLKRAGVTTMLTSEANENNPYASRHGIIEYLTDAVFVLQYVRSDTRETRLAVEIQKIRDANHSRETKPYEITMDGISVYQQANIL